MFNIFNKKQEKETNNKITPELREAIDTDVLAEEGDDEED